MGYTTAWALAADFPLPNAIQAHFESNCFPPFDRKFVPLAMVAVDFAAKGEWTRELLAPDDPVTVAEVVEQFHLEAFVDYQVETGERWPFFE